MRFAMESRTIAQLLALASVLHSRTAYLCAAQIILTLVLLLHTLTRLLRTLV
jgi:hypothetical protein